MFLIVMVLMLYLFTNDYRSIDIVSQCRPSLVACACMLWICYSKAIGLEVLHLLCLSKAFFHRLGGYDQLSCDQPWTVPLMFKLLVSAPPVLFILLSLVFLHRYPINEEFRKKMKPKLAKRRCSHNIIFILNNNMHLICTL